MAGNFTFFTNDSGTSQGPLNYVSDSFLDTTLAASNNTGFSSTVSNNPFNLYFGNDDSTRYGVKTLYIKDLVLISDRSLWVNNEPTYSLIFNESFPGVNGYAFGNINVIRPVSGQTYLQFNSVGDGVGVGGIIQRVQWIVAGESSATGTSQLKLDGASTNTIDYSTITVDPPSQGQIARSIPYLAETSNETRNIHDFRIVANQVNTERVIGVVVYYENSGANIDQLPGVTYVNKTKASSTTGATFPIPSFGSSLGGVASIYKTNSSLYALDAFSASTIISIGQGSSGTNLINVTTGTGASFTIGSGVISTTGSTSYIGMVTGISTDTLTVSPTLSFGISNSIYRSWQSGSTYSISSTLMYLSKSIELNSYQGISLNIFDPSQKYAIWGTNVGVTSINSVNSLAFLGASGFLQIDGYFSALDFETVGATAMTQFFNATVMVNGFPAYSVASAYGGATTSFVKYTAFSSAGPGWNSVAILPGASMGLVGINRINLYCRQRDMGITFGNLAQIDGIQGFANRALSATIMAPGTYQRMYADQMYFKGPWVRSLSSSAAGGFHYTGSTTTCTFRQEFYGKHFGMIGTPGSGATFALDGVGIGLTFNIMNIGSTEGFHTVTYACVSGTHIIDAMDFTRSFGEIKSLQNYAPIANTTSSTSKTVSSEIRLSHTNGYGSTATKIPRFSSIVKLIGKAITLNQSATNGDSFIINEPGLYSISYSDVSTGGIICGLSLNSSQLATSVASINDADVLAIGEGTSTGPNANCTSVCAILNPGDIIRPHTDGTTSVGGVKTRFNIVQLRSFL